MQKIIGSGLVEENGTCDFTWTIGQGSNGIYKGFTSLDALRTHLTLEDIGAFTIEVSGDDVDMVRAIAVIAEVCRSCESPLAVSDITDGFTTCSMKCAAAALAMRSR